MVCCTFFVFNFFLLEKTNCCLISEASLFFAFFVYELLQTKVWLTTNPEGFATIQLPQKKNPSFAKLVRRVNNIEVKKESINLLFWSNPPPPPKKKKKILAWFKNKTKNFWQLFLFCSDPQQVTCFEKNSETNNWNKKKKLMHYPHFLFCSQNKAVEKEKTEIPNFAQIILVSLIVQHVFHLVGIWKLNLAHSKKKWGVGCVCGGRHGEGGENKVAWS